MKLYYFLEGGNEHYLCSTENNLFIYEIWTNTHETGTLLPDPGCTCTFFARRLPIFVRKIEQVKRTKALKQANKPTNQYINNYTKNNLLIALYSTETIYSAKQWKKNWYPTLSYSIQNMLTATKYTAIYTTGTLETLEASSCFKTWTECGKMNLKEAEIYINIILEYDDWCF